MKALYNLTCLPNTLQYVIYGLILLLCILVLWAIITLIKIFLTSLQGMIVLLRVSKRILKVTWRLFLRAGRVTGILTRNMAARIQQRAQGLERNALNGNSALLAVIFIFLPIALGQGQLCNSVQVVQSEIERCTGVNCSLVQSVETTLPSIGSTTCLEFKNATNSPAILQVQLTLDRVRCEFNTPRAFFTWITDWKTHSSLHCPQDPVCSYGYQCHDNATTGPALQHLRTPTSKSACIRVTPDFLSNDHCFVITSKACLMYIINITPIYKFTYEVRDIFESTCRPVIKVRLIGEKIREEMIMKEGSFVSENLTISYQGTFQGSQMDLNKRLVVKYNVVQNTPISDHAFVVETSPPGMPVVGQIGDVQAKKRWPDEMIIAPGMFKCSAVGVKLRCSQTSSPLKTLDEWGHSLPRTIGNHRVYMSGKGELKSTLLVSAPVRMSINFEDFTVGIQLDRVCPRIKKGSLSIKGCYNCLVTALLSLEIYSACDNGMISFEAQGIELLQTAFTIRNEILTMTVPFRSSIECPDFTICAIGSIEEPKSCTEFTDCLEEPNLKFPSNQPATMDEMSNMVVSVEEAWDVWSFAADTWQGLVSTLAATWDLLLNIPWALKWIVVSFVSVGGLLCLLGFAASLRRQF